MKLDWNNLAETPVLARLVSESAVGMSGALELLSDDYRPPRPPVLCVPHVDEDNDDDLVPYEGEHGYPEGEEPVEVDAEGYPAIVKVAPVARPTPLRGVKLIRPRSLSDVQSF